MEKSKNNIEIDPDFTSVTIDQKIYSVNGEISSSLWLPPSSAASSEAMNRLTGRISYFDINQARTEKKDNLDSIRLQYESSQQLEAPDGVKIGVRIVNPIETNESKYTIGVMTSWSTDADWDNERGIVEALALTYPGATIIFIETPGMGDSDKLTPTRRKRLLDSGSFIPMAEQIAPALEVAEIKFDLLVGISEGARAVISLAELSKTPTVVTVDPPGTEDNSLLKFFKGFALDEGAAQKSVLSTTPDTIMSEAHKDYDSKRLAKSGLSAVNKGLLSRARAMAKAGLSSDITSACASGVSIFDYRCGASAIATASVAENLAKITPRYTTITLANAPHAIVEANPFAVSQLVAQALALQNSQNGNYVYDEATEAAKRILED